MSASGGASVTAFASSVVYAYDANIDAQDSAVVEAYSGSTVVARDSAVVNAYSGATVQASGDVTVYAASDAAVESEDTVQVLPLS